MPKPYFHNKNQIIDKLLRVNHAGEYGAVQIYKGQISGIAKNPLSKTRDQDLDSDILKSDDDITTLLNHMLDQEKVHLAYFESQIQSRTSRPTIFLPLWHIGGYLIGKISAIVGPKMAMLCTEAVEEVIDEHYQSQKQVLHDIDEPKLSDKIEKFRLEELEHRDIALDHGSINAFGYRLVKSVISKICKAAIWMSKAA